MTFDYDDQNIFAKILRGEIPNRTVFENDHALAFEDISPQAPVHVLIIPKGAYMSLDHFAAEASAEEQAGFMKAVAEVCRISGVDDGFRAIANTRAHGVQDVPHFHMHILGGKRLGRMLPE
ncbi:MAG: histidine triad (HIT) family protein [Loktanella salsilacus]|jgi:histidine triad (HIT) family protein|uniref:Diadenosine tetraphosphate (Ap4A) hydrolase n=1 Tax=Loktanella salsilacus TaxID=195913 RepID=A0A1I4DKE5_9RHOB|nr:HIT domain-containing protein [Loktanella salsilacus]MBU0779735.1 HIT domain-containing protein [Alphaproteobacteria bacterium]MBU1836367.1 HIT domain-containing protein [Alphaproteobacteria bacterium]UTH44206.1 HIT domain-containing protein [Loktanella salsilacus]UTH47913.1 HIT domain-containing protein [Loktanella salsilacus]SFK92361.1 Diadenosine tetraphosphate (Ap4A) hydrolase [Loktanella salsilacus]|tara:strand:- start:212 stop:574 length:363 start_codon:yes stop_codon:yes gene_type:complete